MKSVLLREIRTVRKRKLMSDAYNSPIDIITFIRRRRRGRFELAEAVERIYARIPDFKDNDDEKEGDKPVKRPRLTLELPRAGSGAESKKVQANNDPQKPKESVQKKKKKKMKPKKLQQRAETNVFKDKKQKAGCQRNKKLEKKKRPYRETQPGIILELGIDKENKKIVTNNNNTDKSGPVFIVISDDEE